MPSDQASSPGSSFAGQYAFRFSGFSMADDAPYYIVGVGKLLLDDKGGLTGSQKSSITRLLGQGAGLEHASYALGGSWTMTADGSGTAQITFQSTDQKMTGSFDLMAVGSNRFWMISSGASVVAPHAGVAYPADEVVSGEAVKIG